MNLNFAQAIEGLDASFEALRRMKPVKAGMWPADMPLKGVYLFSEGRRHLYVGRSNNIRGRHGRHCRPGATGRMAAFAFQLAREATGKVERSYRKGEHSRSGLMLDPGFAEAFKRAKVRIRAMDFRFVEESHQTRQALLEIYCAVALGTPYNKFDNH